MMPCSFPCSHTLLGRFNTASVSFRLMTHSIDLCKSQNSPQKQLELTSGQTGICLHKPELTSTYFCWPFWGFQKSTEWVTSLVWPGRGFQTHPIRYGCTERRIVRPSAHGVITHNLINTAPNHFPDCCRLLQNLSLRLKSYTHLSGANTQSYLGEAAWKREQEDIFTWILVHSQKV